MWEKENTFLNRHFLLKDKLIPWNGKMAHMEIAIDVTEKEHVSKSIQEKLDFEQNIVECTRMLVEEPDTELCDPESFAVDRRVLSGRSFVYI